MAQSNPEASKRVDQIVAGFTNQWSARVIVTETFVDYAQSLAALAEAPAKARKNSEAVASSLKAMSSAFGIYGQALQGTTDLVIELESAANTVRSTRALRNAVNAADSSVQKVAKALALDFQSLAGALKRLDADIEPLLSQSVANRLDLRSLLSANLEVSVATLRAAASKPDWVNAVKDFNATAAAVSKYFEEDARWTGPYFQDLKDTHAKLRSDIRLLELTEKAITTWAKSHGRLRKALEGGLEPDWVQLKQSAENIDKAIKSLTTHAP